MARIRSGRPARAATQPAKATPAARKQPRPSATSSYAFAAEGGKRARQRVKAADDGAGGKGKGRAAPKDDVERALAGMASDDDDELDRLRFRPGADDDEELDSDAAGTSGDEAPRASARKPAKVCLALQRIGGVHSAQTLQQATKPVSNDVDLSEGGGADEEDEDDDGDDYVNIDELLDDDDDAAPVAPGGNESESDDADIDGLDALVNSLPTADGALQPDGGPARKRRRVEERTEAMAENEHAAFGGDSHGKLRLEDMLSSLPAAQKATLRKTLRPLAVTEPTPAVAADGAPAAPRNVLKAPGPLPTPLPSVVQAKVDREAANEQLGKELEGWNATLRKSALRFSSLMHLAQEYRTVKGIGVEGQAFGGNRLTLPLGSASSTLR